MKIDVLRMTTLEYMVSLVMPHAPWYSTRLWTACHRTIARLAVDIMHMGVPVTYVDLQQIYKDLEAE